MTKPIADMTRDEAKIRFKDSLIQWWTKIGAHEEYATTFADWCLDIFDRMNDQLSLDEIEAILFLPDEKLKQKNALDRLAEAVGLEPFNGRAQPMIDQIKISVLKDVLDALHNIIKRVKGNVKETKHEG
jgi:hypothetical protein